MDLYLEHHRIYSRRCGSAYVYRLYGRCREKNHGAVLQTNQGQQDVRRSNDVYPHSRQR